MHIQVLYFEGCPHSERTIELVDRIARREGLTPAIERIEVRSQEDAIRLQFLGSPTVRINGTDVDAPARSPTRFGLACRMYGTSGVPPAETIVAAIQRAAGCA